MTNFQDCLEGVSKRHIHLGWRHGKDRGWPSSLQVEVNLIWESLKFRLQHIYLWRHDRLRWAVHYSCDWFGWRGVSACGETKDKSSRPIKHLLGCLTGCSISVRGVEKNEIDHHSSNGKPFDGSFDWLGWGHSAAKVVTWTNKTVLTKHSHRLSDWGDGTFVVWSWFNRMRAYHIRLQRWRRKRTRRPLWNTFIVFRNDSGGGTLMSRGEVWPFGCFGSG